MKQPKEKTKKAKKSSGIRLFVKILLGLILFLLLLVLFIRSPWGQGIILDKVVSYISNKTQTTVSVERLYITFSGDISMEGVYLEDKAGDTLLYSRILEMDLPLLPLIKGNTISIDNLEWSGVRAHLYRKDTLAGFNYEFLMEAFAPTDSLATTPQDTVKTGNGFEIGDLKLKDFKIDFTDEVTGIESNIDLGALHLEVQEFSLDSMEFALGNVLLENTSFEYSQFQPFPERQDSEDPMMPAVSIENLELRNVEGDYKSIPEGLVAAFDIEEFHLELPKAKLAQKQVIIERLGLRNSNFVLQISATAQSSPDYVEPKPAEKPFSWPGWNVVAEEISIANTDLQFSQPGKPVPEGSFDPNSLDIQDIDFQSNHIALRDKFAEAYIQKFNFRESSGLSLKTLNFDLTLSDQALELTNFNFHLDQSRIQGQLMAEFPSLAGVLEKPEGARIDLSIPEFNIDLKDLYSFQPELRENEYLLSLSQKPLYGNLSGQGTLSEIIIDDTRVHWGANTSVKARGKLNAANIQKLAFEFPDLRVISVRSDLAHFVDEDKLGVQLPEDVEMTGSFRGDPAHMILDATLNSSVGTIDLAGNFTLEPQIAFQTDLVVRELQLGQVLQVPELGSLSLHLNAIGSGANVNDLDAILEATVDSLTYNGYRFTALKLAGELEEGEGPLRMTYKDENLNLELNNFVELDSVSSKLATKLSLIGADLQALGLAQRPINAALDMDLELEGNTTSYDITGNLYNGIAVYSNESYLLGDLDLLAHVREDTSSLDIRNRMVDLSLRSNASPTDFTKALNRHYQSYFSPTDRSDTVQEPVNLELFAEIRPAPVLNEVLLPKLEALDTVSVDLDFREKERTLTADIQLPHIEYFGSEIDSLQFQLDSNKEGLSFNFGLNSLTAGPLAIKLTSLSGQFRDNTLRLDFNSFYKDQKLVQLSSEWTKSNDILSIHIKPDDLILNSVDWAIDPENEIRLSQDALEFEDFSLQRNDQLLRVSHDLPNSQKDHVGLHFENFELATILSYFNPEAVLAAGQLNGEFIIEEPFNRTGMLADLQIKEFSVMDVPMGVLSLEAETTGSNHYVMDLAIKEGDVDLDFTGDFIAREQAAALDLQLDLNEIKMKVIEGFIPEVLHNSSGSFSGSLAVSGTSAEPQYNGNLEFRQAGFTVSALNAAFVFPSEYLQFNNKEIFLNNFQILDANQNSLVLNGRILTENMFNPAFDLDFTAENFTALNATEEDNDLVYGTAVFDATGSLGGNLEVPQVEMELTIKEETDMTYVIPKASLGIEEREGVVVFVNREDPDRILTQTQETEREISFSGIQLSSYITLEENASFTVVLDQETGDRIKASGEGDLVYDMYPNGRTTLSGRLEINDGYYEMSLYDVVSRRFDIMDGSSIVWAGDPFNADLNISAVYRVEASASALMAPQIVGADMDVQQRFRQELPFLVYLNITGELTQPKISFGLDMPEDDQGALGGQVYGRIQQINQQENELNKQVFSLLVLNRFFPDSGSDGSAGGTLSFARDNLNEALSDQLNVFSDRLLGETGVDLNFGLDTYTDYQGESPQERTLLNVSAQKSLMDDRLIVSVGSEVDLQGSSPAEEPSPVIGNVSIEYLLTENGRFRLKAFRRKSFENVIDGQLIISGLSLIFTQEFNKFRELWDQIVKEEKTKNKSGAEQDQNGGK